MDPSIPNDNNDANLISPDFNSNDDHSILWWLRDTPRHPAEHGVLRKHRCCGGVWWALTSAFSCTYEFTAESKTIDELQMYECDLKQWILWHERLWGIVAKIGEERTKCEPIESSIKMIGCTNYFAGNNSNRTRVIIQRRRDSKKAPIRRPVFWTHTYLDKLCLESRLFAREV